MSNTSSGLSTYAEQMLLEALFGKVAYTFPTTLYFAAFSVAPAPSGNTEITGNGYARVAVTNNQTNFPASTGSNPRTLSNGSQIAFPAATGSNWANVLGIGVFDASTSGNLIAWAAVPSTAVVVGNTLTIPVAGFTVGLQ